MEKALWKKRWGFLCIMVQLFLLTGSSLEARIRRPGRINSDETGSYPAVRLHKLGDHHVVLENGIVNLTLATPSGLITGIQYNGIHNLLEYNEESNRGYWDTVWRNSVIDQLDGTSYRIIRQQKDQIEISFLSPGDPSGGGRPLTVDKRFILRRGSSGFYSYAIFERLQGWPAIHLDEARIAFKLQQKLFNYMAISDTRQRFMPSAYDRNRGQPLDYKEAVILTDPYNNNFKGEVDDKYQYSADIKDNRVHGWISSQKGVGFWVITPSNEFRVGGPLKQELTSHVGPTSLAMFFSNHYANVMNLKFQDGEPWKKVFGPVFIYLNKASPQEDLQTLLWKDAKQQMLIETKHWPYDFPLSEDFPHANQRGTVSGRLLVRDRYMGKELIKGNSAYVGLARPGEVRSWQTENKGYQFWTQADAEGNFVIKNVRAGNYNLFSWVPGIIGDFRYDVPLNVTAGSDIKLGNVIYSPPRIGPTLWEIGIPDRTAAEFYVPDPYPDRVNYLYINNPEKFRQYGLWDRYTDLYPNQDLVFTVGNSTYQKDWFFAHVTRKKGNNTYVPTTWSIVFDLKDVKVGTYTLQLALASSNLAELQVRVNDPLRTRPLFTTRLIGRDNAIARHGIHGLYSLYSVAIESFHLIRGINTIYLTQSRGVHPFVGLMYDYIRLEGPSDTR